MFPCISLCYYLKHFYHSAWFVNKKHMLKLASHNRLHMYGFSDIVNLLGSAPDIAAHLWCKTLDTSPVKHKIMIKELKYF